MSTDDARATQQRITALGAEVGFTFHFTDEMKTYNTLAAHQLIHFAREHGKGHETKLALLKAYFTDGRDISDLGELTDIAVSVGLDGDEARKVLEEQTCLEQVKAHLAFWQQQGITGVPAIVLNSKYLINGAAGVAQFKRAIDTALAG